MTDVIKFNPVQKMKTPGREMVEEDFETARNNLLEIIEVSRKSMDELALLCEQSQNDKYYAALSTLLKTYVDANEKLLKLQGDVRFITKKETDKVINNNLIITTDELQQLITNNARKSI